MFIVLCFVLTVSCGVKMKKQTNFLGEQSAINDNDCKVQSDLGLKCEIQTNQLVTILSRMVGRAVAHEYFSNVIASNDNEENKINK